MRFFMPAQNAAAAVYTDVVVRPLFAGATPAEGDPDVLRGTRRAIAAARRGDREAHRLLYERYAPGVFRQVRGLLRDEYEAQDITQLVFLKLMWTIGQYDERQAPFAAWLGRIARNLAIDHLRRRRAVPAPEVRCADTAADDTGADRAAALHTALAALSDEQREVLLLRQVVGMRPCEIASRLDRTEGSVHALHHRARRAMRASLVRLDAAPSTRA
jgi:RNA polymerase sigma-70 factor (ECF subfamily)